MFKLSKFIFLTLVIFYTHQNVHAVIKNTPKDFNSSNDGMIFEFEQEGPASFLEPTPFQMKTSLDILKKDDSYPQFSDEIAAYPADKSNPAMNSTTVFSFNNFSQRHSTGNLFKEVSLKNFFSRYYHNDALKLIEKVFLKHKEKFAFIINKEKNYYHLTFIYFRFNNPSELITIENASSSIKNFLDLIMDEFLITDDDVLNHVDESSSEPEDKLKNNPDFVSPSYLETFKIKH